MRMVSFGIGLILCLCGNVWAQEPSTATVDVLAKTGNSWNGTELPNYATGKPEITILRITIPPKSQLPLHKHPAINAGVLLKGELTVITKKGEILHLKAGDSIVEVVNQWHYGINEGDETAEIIVFYAGTRDLPITVKQQSSSSNSESVQE